MLFTVVRVLSHFRQRKELSVATLILVLVGSVVGNALTFFFFDGAQQPDLTLGDSFWYSIVSITTIGYGDFSAATLGARVGTAFFIIVIGLAAFTSAVGIGVDWIIDLNQKERTGLGKTTVKNHLLIINFPNGRRVRQIIEEFRHDTRHKNDNIVIVTDQIQSLPFALPRVSFIQGSPLEEDTFQRANVDATKQAIVLSTGYDDPNSDSVVASIVSILEHLNPGIRSVAECLNSNHSLLFQGSQNVSLVFTFRIANNLIVQETQDPGVNLLAGAITSNQIEGTLVSTEVELEAESTLEYVQVAKKLLDHDINLVGVIRQGDVHLKFNNLNMMENDRIVYISSTRHDWQSINSMLG